MRKTWALRDRWYLILLLAGVCCLDLSWALIVPFAQAPDERLRYDIVDFILKYHSLPLAGDPRLYYGGYGQTYAALPYFSYLLAGLLGIALHGLGIQIEGYFAGRLVSVAAGVVTVLFVFLIARALFPDRATWYFLPVFLAFTPQFTFISVYVNQDIFMVMLSAMLIYLWVRGARTGWDWPSVVWTGVVCGLMLLSYINGYVCVLATLLMVMLSYPHKLSRGFLWKLLACVGIMAALSGWFFIRNAVYYNGDWLGMHTLNRIAEIKANDGFRPSQLAAKAQAYHGLAGLLFSTSFVRTTFLSFWAVLGNMSVTMNPWYYFYIAGICMVAFIGFSAKLVQKLDGGWKSVRACSLGIALAVTAIGGFAVHCYYSIAAEYQPQGRYMYPGLIAIFLLMTYGFRRVLTGRGRRIFYQIVAFTFVFLDIWIGYIALLPLYCIH